MSATVNRSDITLTEDALTDLEETIRAQGWEVI